MRSWTTIPKDTHACHRVGLSPVATHLRDAIALMLLYGALLLACVVRAEQMQCAFCADILTLITPLCRRWWRCGISERRVGERTGDFCWGYMRRNDIKIEMKEIRVRLVEWRRQREGTAHHSIKYIEYISVRISVLHPQRETEQVVSGVCVSAPGNFTFAFPDQLCGAKLLKSISFRHTKGRLSVG